jgi:hypothetical protein
MSENLPKQPQSSEEVDLGQLFKLIGNMFDRFYRFIAGIFNGIFKLIVMILSHLYKRYIWYVAAVIIGVIGGYFLDKNSDKEYGVNMTIQTNLYSARQVYENISEFHQMAHVDKDSVELAKRFNISPYEASKLKGFYIEPVINDNAIAKQYSDFYSILDSISRLEMTYDRYKASLNIEDHRIHKIGVLSTDKFIFKKIERSFIDALSENAYLDQLQKDNIEILKKNDEVLEAQVQLTDSLIKEYLKIRINESSKANISNSGTNIYMADSKSSGLLVDESKIIEQKLEYENQRRSIDSTLAIQRNVVNILADFPKSGYADNQWHTKKKFTLPIFIVSLTALFFLLFGLGDYIKKLN